MRRNITRALYAAAVAAITLGHTGLCRGWFPGHRGLAVHRPARVQPVLGWLLGRTPHARSSPPSRNGWRR
jgi:hypothetical protein